MKKLGYPVGDCDWVFPSRARTLKQTSSLVNAIKRSKEETGITTRITPHGMRYAFSDLLRAAEIDAVTRRALVGHVTEEMKEHHSTVQLDEKRVAMAQAAARLGEFQGDGRGDKAEKKEAA